MKIAYICRLLSDSASLDSQDNFADVRERILKWKNSVEVGWEDLLPEDRDGLRVLAVDLSKAASGLWISFMENLYVKFLRAEGKGDALDACLSALDGLLDAILKAIESENIVNSNDDS